MSSDAPEQVSQGEAQYISPTSIDELGRAVREASRNGAALRIIGGGTRQAFGNAGQATDLTVSTTGLNKVIDYSPVDLTISVEPGCTIAQINALLAENGQTLPLDAAHARRATIGGSFATGLSGPRRLKHGSLKDRVVGTEVINSTGVLTKSGGIVVKNVSGYELSRLHYGALGAFGIVTRINLKVAPMPDVVIGLFAQYDGLGNALAAARSMAISQLEPDAVFVTVGGGEPRLHVWFSGTQRLAQSQVERAIASAGRADGFKSADSVESDAGRIEAFEPFIDLSPGTAIARVSALPSGQQPVVEALLRAGSREVCADVGSGLVYSIGEPAPEWRDALLESVDRPVFLSLPEQLKQGVDVFGGMDEPAATVLRRLKREYDPGNLFNPGRFALGL